MTDSYVEFGKGGASFVGRDAIEFFKVMNLRNSISLYQKCGIIPTRGFGITKMLALASKYTGQKYKRNEYDRVIKDLTVWIEMMRSALPTIVDKND